MNADQTQFTVCLLGQIRDLSGVDTTGAPPPVAGAVAGAKCSSGASVIGPEPASATTRCSASFAMRHLQKGDAHSLHPRQTQYVLNRTLTHILYSHSLAPHFSPASCCTFQPPYTLHGSPPLTLKNPYSHRVGWSSLTRAPRQGSNLRFAHHHDTPSLV